MPKGRRVYFEPSVCFVVCLRKQLGHVGTGRLVDLTRRPCALPAFPRALQDADKALPLPIIIRLVGHTKRVLADQTVDQVHRLRRKDCVAFPPALEEAIKISSREIERIKGTSQVKDAIAKPHDFIGNFLIK